MFPLFPLFLYMFKIFSPKFFLWRLTGYKTLLEWTLWRQIPIQQILLIFNSLKVSKNKRCPKKNGVFSYGIHYRFLEGIAYPCLKTIFFWKRLKTQVRPSKKSCFFWKKSNQELGGEIEIFFSKLKIATLKIPIFVKKRLSIFRKFFPEDF